MTDVIILKHGIMPHRLNLGKIKVSGNEVVQHLQLIFFQVIFCDSNIFQSRHITNKEVKPIKG